MNAPPVVLGLVALLAAVYLMFLIAPQPVAARLEFWLTLWPRRMFMGSSAPGGWPGGLAPLFTHMFVHTEFLHVFVNAGFLLALGSPVALRIGVRIQGVDQAAANARFLGFFILAGLAGGVVFALAHPSGAVFARGASGAISGLLGAVVRFALQPVSARIADPWKLLPLTDRRVVAASLVIVVSNIALSVIPMFGMTIAGEAHIGGYLFGLLAFPLFALRQSR